MPQTSEQKVFIVEVYFRQMSIHAAQLKFKERFGCHEFPSSMIYRWVSKFRTHGTVQNLNRKDTNKQSHSGRPKSSRTPHNIKPCSHFTLDLHCCFSFPVPSSSITPFFLNVHQITSLGT